MITSRREDDTFHYTFRLFEDYSKLITKNSEDVKKPFSVEWCYHNFNSSNKNVLSKERFTLPINNDSVVKMGQLYDSIARFERRLQTKITELYPTNSSSYWSFNKKKPSEEENEYKKMLISVVQNKKKCLFIKHALQINLFLNEINQFLKKLATFNPTNSENSVSLIQATIDVEMDLSELIKKFREFHILIEKSHTFFQEIIFSIEQNQLLSTKQNDVIKHILSKISKVNLKLDTFLSLWKDDRELIKSHHAPVENNQEVSKIYLNSCHVNFNFNMTIFNFFKDVEQEFIIDTEKLKKLCLEIQFKFCEDDWDIIEEQ